MVLGNVQRGDVGSYRVSAGDSIGCVVRGIRYNVYLAM